MALVASRLTLADKSSFDRDATERTSSSSPPALFSEPSSDNSPRVMNDNISGFNNIFFVTGLIILPRKRGRGGGNFLAHINLSILFLLIYYIY